jgi:hypothetical protein
MSAAPCVRALVRSRDLTGLSQAVEEDHVIAGRPCPVVAPSRRGLWVFPSEPSQYIGISVVMVSFRFAHIESQAVCPLVLRL